MNCESCSYYIFDEEMECYMCQMPMDEDEVEHLLTGSQRSCPFYRYDNEYEIVRKQN